MSASRQNAFFTEILEALGQMMEAAGVEVETSLDCFPTLAEDLVYLFVPHEFKALVREIAQPTKAQLRRTVSLCTEQPGTQWFDLSAALAAESGAAVDINSLGVQHLRARGIAADRLPLGYVPAWDRWGGEPQDDRSIDLVFLGGHTDRRGHLLARCAPHLQERQTAIRLAEPSRPHAVGEATFWSGDEKWRMLADSRLLLNVHRTALPYLEWHRFLGAQINGCVVVSEHCVDTDPMVPGRDYLSAGYWQLPGVVGAALEDPEALEEIGRSTYRFLREEMPASLTTEAILGAVERARANPVARATGPVPEPVPLPEPEQPPRPPWEEYAEYAGESLALRRGIKHLVTRMQNLERGLAAILNADQEGSMDIRTFGPAQDAPRVSVILTVHNYADFVGEAIRSVALSSLEEVELVAVDDASTDRSIEAVEAAARQYPWLTVTHIRLARNRGLPLARNLAVSHARAELIFVLDADNEILPNGLALLANTLEDVPAAAFAYGIIETFDEKGPRDLLSWHPWDPAKLRQGNYIDAMAMIRRSVLEEIGGYTSDPALYGWEDYDLWLHLADLGHEGVQVPNFIGRYRSAQHSMIALTGIDNTAAWGAILRRYPSLGRPLDPPELFSPEPVPTPNS